MLSLSHIGHLPVYDVEIAKELISKMLGWSFVRACLLIRSCGYLDCSAGSSELVHPVGEIGNGMGHAGELLEFVEGTPASELQHSFLFVRRGSI
jgi:hypothetical protein